MAHVVKVGSLYHPTQKSWPEGAAWAYQDGRYDLLLRFSQPSRAETEAVAEGSGALAFFEHESALLGLYRFGENTIPWSDMPMEPHRWAALPTGEQVPIALTLLDARNGIVRALRVLLLPEAFCGALAAAARRASETFNPEKWAQDFRDASAALSSEQMARAASHVAEHGPKRPGARA